MRQKVLELVSTVAQVVAKFGKLEGVVVMDDDRDVYDPYFVVSIDAYFSGPVASGQERQLAFDFVGAFEAGPVKDRFLAGELPVRVQYRDLSRYLGLLQGEYEGFVGDTYALRRLVSGTVVSDPASSLGKLRKAALGLSGGFWESVVRYSAYRLEHALEDMQAASLKEDVLYFAIARGRVLDGLMLLACAINKAFAPSPRQYTLVLDGLPHVPSDFRSRLRTLLSWSAEPMNRQAELAEILVNDALSLGVVSE